jgi:iron complex outermembrane receptor protein
MKLLTGCALLALNSAFAVPLYAQTAANSAAPNGPDAAGEVIIVTGTRDIGRTQFDTAAPVDIISSDAIDSVVSSDLATVLARQLPSFNVQRLPAADGQAFVRPATLRGLSPDHTLVMVNGKRYHRSALLGSRGAQAPDLNTFPGLAIKQVEVLRDGASAQYGSDAIAGVINFILDDTPGLQMFGQYSQYYKNDGDAYKAGLQGGVALGDRGSLAVTAEFSDGAATSRTRQRPDAIALQAARPDLAVPNPVQRWGQPETQTLRGAFNLKYELSDAVEFYAFGTAADGNGVTDFNWRNPVATGSVFKGTVAFPGFNFISIYPAGFTPRFGTEFSDLQAVGGLRGGFGNGAFTYDLSASTGRSRIEYNMSETLNASLGPKSPTSFYLGLLEQREFNLNADFVYQLEVGGYQPLNVAFGAERRKETYEVGAGDPASYAIGSGAAEGLAPNANGFPGFSPIQAGTFNQTSHAGYLDVELQPVEILTIGAAARYEDYSDFGDTFNYKFSGRVEPVDGFALRATYSTGFRAPTPAQLNTANTSQGLDTVTLQVFNRGRLSPSDPLAVLLGAKPLTPEESESITAGLAYQGDNGFSASIDLYQIKVDRRFGQSSTFAVPLGVANPDRFTGVSYFTNDFNTRTRGIDAVLAYRGTAGPGTLSTSIAYNYNETKVTGGTSATIGNETQRRIFEERLPKNNATATLGYKLGDFDVTLHGRYYGAWTDSSGNATGDIFQKFGAIMLFDVSVGYEVNEHVNLVVGAENLFDTYPDEATFQANRGLIYSRNAPYDTDGGQYYVRLGVKF